LDKDQEDKKLTEFLSLLRAGKFTAARELLPSPDVTDPPCWHLARLDLERLEVTYPEAEATESKPSARRRNILASIRPLEAGFMGHWIVMMTGFLPLVVGVLALEYPPLWFGIVLSLFGLGEVWLGRKVLEGWRWVPKVLWIHALILATICGLGFLALLFGGENTWLEVGARRGVILPYGLAAFFAAEFLTLRFLGQGNIKSFYGECRCKSDYQIADETALNPLKWFGAILMILALGALFNFLNLDPKTRMLAAQDPLTLPLELPGADYLSRIWIILYSLLFPYFNPNAQIVDINALVAAERIGCVFAFALLGIAGWGLWRRKWWAWGAGIAVAVVFAGSLGDLLRLMGNPNATSMLAINTLLNLGIAVGLIWALSKNGVKLALGADADANLALAMMQKPSEGKKGSSQQHGRN
jgi:hypothetical protein